MQLAAAWLDRFILGTNLPFVVTCRLRLRSLPPRLARTARRSPVEYSTGMGTCTQRRIDTSTVVWYES